MAVPSAVQGHHIYLYGGNKEWNASEWTTTDDRVRGGSSVSHLTPSLDGQTARFHGHLDTSTLGGAGFASQNSKGVQHWDLSKSSGLFIRLEPEQVDGKRYVVTLKDEIPGHRDDGRQKSSVSWEAEFTPNRFGNQWLNWSSFKATYRGRPKNDAKPLDLKNIKRIGLMMRSFFDEQHGDFDLVLKSIAACHDHELCQTRRASQEMHTDEELDSLKKNSIEGPAQPGGQRQNRSWWRGLFCGRF